MKYTSNKQRNKLLLPTAVQKVKIAHFVHSTVDLSRFSQFIQWSFHIARHSTVVNSGLCYPRITQYSVTIAKKNNKQTTTMNHTKSTATEMIRTAPNGRPNIAKTLEMRFHTNYKFSQYLNPFFRLQTIKFHGFRPLFTLFHAKIRVGFICHIPSVTPSWSQFFNAGSPSSFPSDNPCSHHWVAQYVPIVKIKRKSSSPMLRISHDYDQYNTTRKQRLFTYLIAPCLLRTKNPSEGLLHPLAASSIRSSAVGV